MSYRYEDTVETSKELFAGTIGACSGIIAGQPLDFVKVRLQSQPLLYKNVLQTVKITLRNEGTLAFFRGMSSPLIGNAPINALVFGCNSIMNRWFDKSLKNNTYKYSQLFLSGCIAGGVQTIICSPIELIKCRMQVAAIPEYSLSTVTTSSPLSYSASPKTSSSSVRHHKITPTSAVSTTATAVGTGGIVSFHPSPTSASITNELLSTGQQNSWRCVSEMYRNHGPGILFRGFWATFLRDCPSYGVWFATFEFTKLQLVQRFPTKIQGTSSSTPSTSHLLVAGAVAGCATWTVVYPMDVFKSLIQTMPLSTPLHRRKIVNVARHCWNEGGWARCWRGWQSTMLRAAPVSAITFYVYETCLKNMNGVGLKYIDWE